jgi:hypothetical protein
MGIKTDGKMKEIDARQNEKKSLTITPGFEPKMM